MKQALVTGGCGFLGSSIVRALLSRGVSVRVLALPNEPTDNVEGLEVEVVRGNVVSPDDCAAAVKGCDTVFHAAAIYQTWAPNPGPMYKVNLSGTFHMLEACRREGVERVVYTASVVSLGRPTEGQVGDEDTAYEGWDVDFHYSRSKFLSRELAEDFAAWGLDVRVVCPALVFGPRDIAPTPSGKLILEAASGKVPPICAPGGCAYVDVRDAAEVHVLAAEKGRKGERYIAAATNLDNEALLRAIHDVLGIDKRLFSVPATVASNVIGAMNAFATLTGTEPAVAKTMFDYSVKPSFFRADKSMRELGATYRPVKETIRDAVEYFRTTGQL